MRRRSFASLLVASFAALVAAAPASAGTLDQQQTSFNSNPPNGIFSTQSLAQTFTAGVSGRLDQVDLLLSKFGTPPPNVTVEIRATSAGKPGPAALATTIVATSAIGTTEAFVPFRFAAPALVTAGTRYAIVAYSPGSGGNSVGWFLSTLDPYPSGAKFTNTQGLPPNGAWNEQTGADFAFKTYVSQPITATCRGQQATMVGTPGNDEITGTLQRDVIVSLGGSDRVSGLGASDLICGGAGKDKLRGGHGNDRLYGEGGADKLKGAGGNDFCKGGKGRDLLTSC